MGTPLRTGTTTDTLGVERLVVVIVILREIGSSWHVPARFQVQLRSLLDPLRSKRTPLLSLRNTLPDRSRPPPLHQLHERVQDHPHRREQQPEDQHREPAGEDDVVERPGLVVPGEGV
ncbi:MAG: hypothetical protein ACOYCB_11020, partial [Fastidiosipilaceae bacterium]